MSSPPDASPSPATALADIPAEVFASYAVATQVLLEGLAPAEARARAIAIAGAPAGEAEEAALSRVLDEQLGGLPMAVELAARAVAQWAGTWVAYEALLPALSRASLDAPDPRSAHYPYAVMAALNLAIDRCGQRAQRLLERAAWYEPGAVPLPCALFAAGLEAGTPAADEACAELEARGLAGVDREAATVSLLWLVRRRARDRMDLGAWRANDSRAADLVQRWLHDGAGMSAWGDPAEDVVERILAEAERLLDPPAWSALAQRVADHYLLHRRDRAAQLLLERALPVEEARLGPDHPEVGALLARLASLIAGPLDRRRQIVARPALDLDDDPLFDLDALLRGMTSQAQPLLERALRIEEAAYGPDHVNVAKRLAELSTVLPAAEARPLLERALAIAENALPADDPRVAFYRRSLAAVQGDAGEE